MPDLYTRIAEQPDAVLDAIETSLDLRAGDPEIQRICADYMARLPRPGARVLEIGCGAGASTGLLAQTLSPAALLGIDPSPGLLERARRRFAEDPAIEVALGDAVATGQAEGAFDLVVAHTVYSHLPDPDAALAEAFRVLRPGGTLAIFDGDYAANTVALFAGDPLQAAMEAVQRNLIHAPHVMRSLAPRARAAGFEVASMTPYAYVQTDEAGYMRSLIGRGVAAAEAAGELGDALAGGFVAEAARRSEAGTFYGAILFLCLIARRPEA